MTSCAANPHEGEHCIHQCAAGLDDPDTEERAETKAVCCWCGDLFVPDPDHGSFTPAFVDPYGRGVVMERSMRWALEVEVDGERRLLGFRAWRWAVGKDDAVRTFRTRSEARAARTSCRHTSARVVRVRVTIESV